MKKTLTIAALFLAALTGSAFAADNYDLSIDAPSATASAKAVAKIKVEPKGDFHMNLEYPTKLTLTAPDGVTVEKAKQTAKDAVKLDKHSAEFDVAFTAASPGKKSFTGVLKFAVCSADSCKPQKKTIAFDVDVK